jgi:DNA-binding NarL/FixJ family response regulator
MGPVATEAPAVTCAVIGSAGLAVELYCQLLRRSGLAVASIDNASAQPVDVVVLVEPQPTHWDVARGLDVPIVLVLGQQVGDAEIVDAVLAGAEGVVHADTAAANVVQVVVEVSRGGSVLCPRQTRIVAQLARSAAASREVALTPRESEIVASIAEGKAVKQTARDLGISAKTVENLQGRLFRKLGVRNRAQAVARAHGLGLL